MRRHQPRLLNTLPTIESLICFEAVARCGSFTLASKELSLSQSAVSKQVKALEEVLQCGLLERHARGISLSAAGFSFINEIEPMLYKLHRAVLSAKEDLDSQAVTIACTQAVAHFWLFPRIVQFNLSYPTISINVVSDNTVSERKCLDSDLGILYGDGDWPSLEQSLLFQEVVYPISRPDLDLPTPVDVKDFTKFPLIQLDSSQWNCLDWRDWFEHFDVHYEVPRNALTFNQVTLSFNAAHQGLGVALGWEFMARPAIDSGTLQRVGDFTYGTGRCDFLVHAKHRPLPEQAATFKSWLLQSL
jgi:LysR family transcriptional regulator, glycine cleavage system transcriptional activator